MASRINYRQSKPPLGAVLNGAHQLSRGVVGCWLFNEKGGTRLNDISGRYNNGTLTNGPIWKNQNLSFDGVDDYVNIGDLTAMNGISGLTISAWAQPKTLADYRGIIGKAVSGNATNRTGFGFGSSAEGGNDDAVIYLANGLNSYAYTTSNIFAVGIYKNFVMTFDGTQTGNSNRLKFYVNGTQQSITFVSTIPATTTALSNALVFGGEHSSASKISSIIDNVRIYNRALSAHEVMTLYTNPYAGIMMPRRRMMTQQQTGGNFFPILF